MKKYFSFFFLLPFLLWGMEACDTTEVTYSGDEYVMFSDSAVIMPVFNKDTLFNVPVGTTTACDYDRTFAVEVMESRSNAIEGVHYEIIAHNVTIKAGERAGVVTIRGLYDNINADDSLCVRLKLVADKTLKWPLYTDEIGIEIRKCYPLNVDDFLGNMRMYATFPFSDSEVKKFVVTTEKRDNKMLVIKNPFDKHYDLTLRFDDSDPLEPWITVLSQVAFVDANYGKVYCRSVEQLPSLFSTPHRSLQLRLECYVKGVGSFGVYEFYLEWITQEEADNAKNGI